MFAGAGLEVMVREGHLVLRALSPASRLRKGFRLHADDPGDPYLFRLDLADLGLGTWPVAFSRNGDGTVAALHLGSMPMSLASGPATRPGDMGGGRCGAAGVAGAAAALGLTRRR